ncbi:MAG: MFS transporter [Ectothiorhodospiraceae bacterium]|nr:MFS transporter [Chromatiales bacterium]MCP5156361.1 MFS transporter [Ectothiorhodospiraceae bacterium]
MSGQPGLIRVMVVVGAYLAAVNIHRSGGAVIANGLADAHGFSPADLGTITGAMFLAAAVMQIPFGLLYDRYGPRQTLAGMGLIGTVGIVIFALGETVPALFLGRFLTGVGQAGVVTGVFLLSMAWARPERTATVAATTIGAAGGVGGLLATTPLALALTHHGFAVTFGIIAALNLALVALIQVAARDAPAAAETPDTPPRRPETLRQSLRGLWSVATDRRLWGIFAMGSCFAAPYAAIGGLWAGPYLVTVHQLSTTEASYVLLAMTVTYNLGTFLYGPMDRVFDSRKRVVLGGAWIMAGLLGALALLDPAPMPVAVALLVAFPLFASYFVTLVTHCRAFVPASFAGRAVACVNLFGISGIFVLQAGTGVVIEAVADAGADPALGFRLTFGLVAALLVAVSVPYLARVPDVRPSEAAGPAGR